MSRRKAQEIQFGSDSFLDVIANIVGILIILIVVAGVKVARTPVSTLTAAPVISHKLDPELEFEPHLPDEELDLPETEPEPISEPLPPLPAENLLEADNPAEWLPPVELPPDEPLPTLPEAAPPPELVAEVRQLERQVGDLKQKLAETLATVDTQAQQMQQLNSKASETEALATQSLEMLQSRREQLAILEEELLKKHQRVADLQRQQSTLQTRPAPTEKITHHLTPIGQKVEGDEIHFRLAGNRVSHVPLLELANRVQADMERRKDLLLTRSFFQGSVAPSEGYRLEYVMQRESALLTQERRPAPGMIRILVTNWIITPEPNLVAETAEEALKSDSRFVAALRKSNPSATVTFWVYPDSFDIHQKLREIVRDTGFRVASRPLPEGVPIAGSPQGTKSIAQ